MRLIAWLFTATCLLVPRADAQTSDGSLTTYVRLLVGHPHPQIDRPDVVVYPGTVVLPGEDATEKARGFQHLLDELTAAYRLADLRPDRWTMLAATRGESKPVPAIEGGPTVVVTLLDFDATRATYQIVLTEGGARLAEPRITVRRGDRAIVGTRNGAAAPYLFLLVEPLPTREGDLPPEREPKKVHHVNPLYPQRAREAGVSGLVLLDCHIDEEGAVREMKVIHGEPMGLTEAAMEAISGWRYEPPLDTAGRPTDLWLTVTVAFRLSEDALKGEP